MSTSFLTYFITNLVHEDSFLLMALIALCILLIIPLLLLKLIFSLLSINISSYDISLMVYSTIVVLLTVMFSIMLVFFQNEISFFLSMYFFINVAILNISSTVPDIKLIYKISIYLAATVAIHFALISAFSLYSLRKPSNVLELIPFAISTLVFFIIIKFDPHLTSTAEINILNHVTTAGIIAYTFGGILINWKILINKNSANKSFRNMIKGNTPIDYHSLVKCAYGGGTGYENLMLNNEQLKNIIMKAEHDIQIPENNLYKKKIINFLKKTWSFVQTIYKNIFNRF